MGGIDVSEEEIKRQIALENQIREEFIKENPEKDVKTEEKSNLVEEKKQDFIPSEI